MSTHAFVLFCAELSFFPPFSAPSLFVFALLFISPLSRTPASLHVPLPACLARLQLLEKVWDYCNMIRIYTKPKGQIPDYNEPVILHDTNPSLEQFCNRIHRVRLYMCGWPAPPLWPCFPRPRSNSNSRFVCSFYLTICPLNL